jgi:hypothetical protein
VNPLDGLDLEALDELDSRILTHPSLNSMGAIWRLRRWVAAGQPAPDIRRRLSYVGDSEVRAIICDVIAKLPPPVAHYAVEAITWFEAGRGSRAWCCRRPAIRELPGDIGHVIQISSGLALSRIAGTVGHELGHGWHFDIVDAESRAEAIAVDEIAVRADAIRYRTFGLDDEQRAAERQRAINAEVAEEMRADAMAALWGVPHDGLDEATLREIVATRYDSAAARLGTLNSIEETDDASED